MASQRDFARQAFHEVVPAEILAREDKEAAALLWMTKIRDSQPSCAIFSWTDGW